MIEALKASNFFYRWFLKYSFWMSNMAAKNQWGVLLGFFFGMRLLRSIARHNEFLRPFLMPIIICLTIMAFSTWIIKPVSNLFLRLNKYGRHLLKKKEIMSSNFVGVSFVLFVLGMLGYWATGVEGALATGFFGLAMMLPLGTMFSPSKMNSLVIYTGFMGVVGVIAIYSTFATGELINTYTNVFLISFLIFQFVANFLMIKEDNI